MSHQIGEPVLVCGLDEVGRGAGAGPIVAVAALFWCGNGLSEPPIPGIKDSKAFTGPSGKKKRWKVFKTLLMCDELVSMGVGQVGPREIDKKGIDWANREVFRQAVSKLRYDPELLIIDGTNGLEDWPEEKQLVKPKADALHWQVGAASILAKEIRDQLMREIHSLYPHYDWSENAGYLSERHLAGLKAHGPTKYHRRSFLGGTTRVKERLSFSSGR